MRLGKFVEHIKAAAVATDAKNMDPVLRFCAVGRQLGYAAYMTLDNITAVRDVVSLKRREQMDRTHSVEKRSSLL